VHIIHYNVGMTTLERRRNWKISVYGREHGMPHVHVTGPNFRASIAIATGAVLSGHLPASVLREVQDWLDINRPTVLERWHAHNPTL